MKINYFASQKVQNVLRSKKAKIALRFFTYGVMTVAVLVISAFCVLLALGYRFDRQDLSFHQGGLIQVASHPSGAQVAIDGKDQNYQTSGKSNLAPGRHTVTLTKKGYRDWSKTVPLAAGQLLWLNYARLFPDTIQTTAVHTFETVNNMMVSPDQHWAMVQLAGDKPDFVVADLGDPTKPKFSSLQIPADTYTTLPNQPGAFTIVEWDLNSRYVLVKHQTGTNVEYLRLDRTNQANIINITRDFQLVISEVHFSAGDANVLYAHEGDVLRRIDLGSNTTSGALVTGLKNFAIYGSNQVAYSAVTQRTPGDTTTAYQIVGMYQNQDTKVREYPAADVLLVDYSEYFGHGYMAIADATTQQLTLIRDPTAAGNRANRTYATIKLTNKPDWLYFSDNGRMVVVQSGNEVVNYDLETSAKYTFAIPTTQPVTVPFKWLDDYYLETSVGGVVKVFEFDGQNERDIVKAENDMGTSLVGDGKYILSIRRDTTHRYGLQLSRLVLP